jgi:hypothetical protein
MSRLIMTTFRLRFPETEISHWANRYPLDDDSVIENQVAPPARKRGYLTRDEFLAICRWKSPRSKPRCERNGESFVQEVTRISLSAIDEEVKIRVLLLLSGVSWPTASVILHLCDRGRYPVLDYRVLWSLRIQNPPAYDFEFWAEYCGFVRVIADRTGHDMRTIDRALWQFSKEKQLGSRS